MANRMHQSHNFPQNFTHGPFQQSHRVPRPPPPRPQQQHPHADEAPAIPAPSEFGQYPSTWRDTSVRDPSSHGKRDGDVAESHNHQTQGSVRGPIRSQYGQGRPGVQQDPQYIGPNAQRVNRLASYNTQVNHPRPQFSTHVPPEPMNSQLQTNHHRVFNTGAMMHEPDTNNQVVSHYRKGPSQDETIRFSQPGHGAPHTSGSNHFTSISLQPPHDQPRAFPDARPVGGTSRSTMPGSQPMGGLRRRMSTEFPENNRLPNGVSKSDDLNYMRTHPQAYASSNDPPAQQRITQRRVENDHRKEAHYENPSRSNRDVPDILQQFERLRVSDSQVIGPSTQTYQAAAAMIPSGSIMRENAQRAHEHDPDRINSQTGLKFSYDVDLFRYITREGDYAIAGGGNAEVFKGTLSFCKQATKVAIKAIRLYSNDNDIKKKLQRLQREIEVWRKLDHDSVLKLLGTTSGYGPFPAMVCPWLENGTLTSYLELHGAKLQMSRILMLIYEVASGLQYLHSQSVVHGDLSGANVLVDEKGQACIADFGLSTIMHESGVSAFVTPSTTKLRTTLRWAAPELLDPQDDGNTRKYTKQSDIYSFGGIMLQILSGNIPYYHYPRDAQVVAAISRGETTKRPNDPRVTDRRWMFIQQCWSPFHIVYQRPSSDDIVAFSKDDLVRKDIQAGATGFVHGSRYPTL